MSGTNYPINILENVPCTSTSESWNVGESYMKIKTLFIPSQCNKYLQSGQSDVFYATNSPSWRMNMPVKAKFCSSDFICEIIVKTTTPKLFKIEILAFVLQIDFYCWTLILKCIVRLLPTLLWCSEGAIQTNLRAFFLPQWM